MKRNQYLFIAILTYFTASATAQSCIDSSLIDLTVMCPAVWDPVCGCNGVTYGNECEAVNYGGVTAWVSGECTGTNLDCTDLGGIDFGACDMAMGVVMWNGSCTYLSGCGWEVNGIDYSVYSFWSMEECEDQCGSSECIDPSLADPLIDCNVFDPAPVCGCDSLSHFNECVATYVDFVSAYTPGACPNDCFDEARLQPEMGCPEFEDPVCGCDSVTYSNACEAWYHGGIAQWTPGPCESVAIENAHHVEPFWVYPNPAQNQIIIGGWNSDGPVQVRLLNLNGQMLAQTRMMPNATWSLPSDVAAGLYILEVQLAGRKLNQMLVIE